MARGPCSWLSLSCPNGHTFTACESVRPQKGEREGDRAWLTVIDLGWGRGGNGLGSLRLIFLTQHGKRTLSSAALDLPLWSSFIACQSESVRPQRGRRKGAGLDLVQLISFWLNMTGGPCPWLTLPEWPFCSSFISWRSVGPRMGEGRWRLQSLTHYWFLFVPLTAPYRHHS